MKKNCNHQMCTVLLLFSQLLLLICLVLNEYNQSLENFVPNLIFLYVARFFNCDLLNCFTLY